MTSPGPSSACPAARPERRKTHGDSIDEIRAALQRLTEEQTRIAARLEQQRQPASAMDRIRAVLGGGAQEEDIGTLTKRQAELADAIRVASAELESAERGNARSVWAASKPQRLKLRHDTLPRSKPSPRPSRRRTR